MYIDVAEGDQDWREIYRLCIGFVNPRPIALVSTTSQQGLTNLAPFSFYNMVSAHPPIVMFCPGLTRDATKKDTLVNVKATGEFVIATVTEAIAEPMVRCAANLPHGRSEFEFSGLTPVTATRVRPPLVRESPVNMECTLRQVVSFGEQPGAGSAVFGDIVALHIADWILDEDGQVDARKLRTVGRLGGSGYCTVTEPYELHIPKPG